MRIKNKHKHILRRPHLQKGGGSKESPPSCRKDKKVNQMSLTEVQKEKLFNESKAAADFFNNKEEV